MAAVEVMAFLLHSKQKQQSAEEMWLWQELGCVPTAHEMSQKKGPGREFSPEHSSPAGGAGQWCPQASQRAACVAEHFTNKDNPCSEGSVFSLGPKRKILKKKSCYWKSLIQYCLLLRVVLCL